MNREERDNLAYEYLDASAELDDLVNGPHREAGRFRDYGHLLQAIREALSAEVRSSIRVVMARETLNAFEEGLREPFKRCPSTYEDGYSGIDCDLRQGHPGVHRWDAGDVLEWNDSE